LLCQPGLKKKKSKKKAFLIPQIKQTGDSAHSQLPAHPLQQQQEPFWLGDRRLWALRSGL